ncbi:MAG: thermonuclease family protein [Gaiellaceae bacterium]
MGALKPAAALLAAAAFFASVALVLLATAVVAPLASGPPNATLARVDHVADGDTLTLRNGQRVRLVQIDTPEVYFRPECYGRQASRATKQLLPPGTLVRLLPEPATDRLDQYGRLLRYVVRVRDGLDVNVQLVRRGAAAPYFYRGRHGRYWRFLDRLGRQARARHLGLWGACPGTPYQPGEGVRTGRPR